MTCIIEGCVKPAHTRGVCHAHYKRWRRYGDIEVLPKVRRGAHQCRMPDCVAPVWSRGLCHRHCKRWQRHGDPSCVLPRGGPRGPRGPSGPRDPVRAKAIVEARLSGLTMRQIGDRFDLSPNAVCLTLARVRKFERHQRERDR